ncbi:hypothetical protein X777_09917 [Ooceraea biroi]|uniref:Uncharacterized protein n=1 Tax=Ooceraea biroi TaxID=2015173 RepID=A0A026W584_OOCBI|nr:hypothetical protein X777_09917 [Ooceraea biroi]
MQGIVLTPSYDPGNFDGGTCPSERCLQVPPFAGSRLRHNFWKSIASTAH